MSRGTFKIDEACRYWWTEVSGVASLYERRWTRMALNRIDEDLAMRLAAQQSLFDSACFSGTVADIELQGGAMCRGWLAAIQAMEEAGAPDDAYMLGSDPKSGMRVAISGQKASAARVVDLHGQDVIWISPDEVAVLMGNVEQYKPMADIKKLWPGAEITRYESEGT